MNKLLFLFICTAISNSLFAQNPTWADDVACIVYSHCSGCHNANGSGPFSLMNYTEVKDNASAIESAVTSKVMPPWPNNNAYRKMAHDRTLTEQEILTISQWVQNGTPMGNMANAPAAPVYSSNLSITNPDLKLRIPNYTLPQLTEDLYRCFVMPTGMSIQKFITGIEIIPGNKNIVHHVQVFYDTTGQSTVLDNNDPNPGYSSAGGIGVNAAVLLGTWVPGATPIYIPNGMGKRLPSSAKIVLQIHYPEFASGQMDSTKVHFSLTTSTVRNIYDAPVLNHVSTIDNGPLFIPKNTVKTFYESYTLPATVTIVSIFPHGHLICKQLKAFAVNLSGDTIPLIDIPDWDFHWQGTYDFQKPIVLPIGTKLVGMGVYDNTTNNSHNPNSPPQDVSAGEATTDEMMLFYFSYLGFKPGDANIVIDTNSHKPHHLNCISTAIAATETHLQIDAQPNPFNSLITLSNPNDEYATVTVYNALGQKVFKGEQIQQIATHEWPSGMYVLKLQSQNTQKTIKLIKPEF